MTMDFCVGFKGIIGAVNCFIPNIYFDLNRTSLLAALLSLWVKKISFYDNMAS